MDLQPTGNEKCESQRLDTLLQCALLLDLEVSHTGSILKLGAVLGETTLTRSGSASFAATALELNQVAQRARCLLVPCITHNFG
jgi:hypothetical protein